MSEQELKDKIADLKKKAANKSLPASAVSALNKMIDKLEAELPKEKESKSKKYVLGDMWSHDFDDEGMWKMALTTTVGWGVTKLGKLYDSLEDNNYHTANKPLGEAIALMKKEEAGYTIKAAACLVKFHDAVREQIGEAPVKKAVHKEKSHKEKDEKTITVKGKEYNVDDCKEAMEAWNARIKQHEEAQGRYKTKSTTAKVADNVTTAVSQAMKEIPSGKSAETVIKEIKDVKDAVENLFSRLETLLDKEFSDAKVKAAFDIIKQAVKKSQEQALKK